jgi:flagellar motor switch protein FliN/FliY
MADDPNSHPDAVGEGAPRRQGETDTDSAGDSGGTTEINQADIDAALAADAVASPPIPTGIEGQEDAVADETGPSEHVGEPVDLPAFTGRGDGGGDKASHDIDLLHDVNLQVKIELGRTRMTVDDVLKLDEGSVVELDKLAGDPVDVYANDRLIARGEVLVLNDNFCVRVSEILSEQLSDA